MLTLTTAALLSIQISFAPFEGEFSKYMHVVQTSNCFSCYSDNKTLCLYPDIQATLNIRKIINKDVMHISNTKKEEISKKNLSIWQRWVVPTVITIGSGATVYFLYKARGR